MKTNTQKLFVALAFLFFLGLVPVSCGKGGARQGGEKQATSTGASLAEPTGAAQVAAAQPAAPLPTTQETKSLPHTGSLLPLAGVLGLLALGAGWTLRVFLNRRGLIS